jgi:prepilin signal peptidase PulO-like enzyme (type II secretory pathway)
VISKFWKHIPNFKNKRLAFDLLYTLSLYYVFFAAIIISDILFLLSVTRLVSIALPGPYTFVWIMAFVLFIFEIMLAVSYDREDSLTSIALILLMYFTYCQLWIYVVIRATYLEKDKNVWVKTVRFDIQEQKP